MFVAAAVAAAPTIASAAAASSGGKGPPGDPIFLYPVRVPSSFCFLRLLLLLLFSPKVLRGLVMLVFACLSRSLSLFRRLLRFRLGGARADPAAAAAEERTPSSVV